VRLFAKVLFDRGYYDGRFHIGLRLGLVCTLGLSVDLV